MLRCEICFSQPQTDLLTRCCKLFICPACQSKYEKTGVCPCGKSVAKKLASPAPQLFDLIQNYYDERDDECDRCDDPAELQCTNCAMLFCSRCNSQVHNGKGFAKHKRQPYVKGRSPQNAAQRAKKKQDWCKEHSQPNETICECGMQLCGTCSKSHKDICSKGAKTRSLKEYKEEYFSQVLFKIKQITEYKERLLEEKRQYAEHYLRQKQVYSNYRKLMQQQLEGLKKILQVKSTEINNRLSSYWRQCENIHHKNAYVIDYYLKKYDDYGRLSEKFIENTIGLDYLQKRVKRIYINHDFFNFKVTGVDDIQTSIINMTSSSREWENKHDNILLNSQVTDERSTVILKEKKMDLLGNIAANSEILLECSQNPLNHRPLILLASHNQIQYQFLHLPYQDDVYEIQYGIGFKSKGQEVFKRLKNTNGVGVIDNLNPSTKYRVRMRVVGGEWGPISEIKTQQPPKLLAENGALMKNYSEPGIQFIKSGVVYGSNEINFGTHEWQMRIFPTHHSDQQTACISIGVSNKQQKKPIFVGSTFNYGYHKADINVKISLNCSQNRLLITIMSSNGKKEETFQNLPNYPIYPAVQNKGSHPVQILCSFL